MLNGVITKGIGGFYYVDTTQGIYETRARGIFRKKNITPTVGDFVEISILDEANKKGSLDAILERKNELIRPKVCNIDQAVIVFGAKSPNINTDLLDRFLILAEEQGLDIMIIINKIDMIDLENDSDFQKIKEIYESAGYPLIFTSAEKNIGIEALKEALANKISVFAGPSGVGKSTLINTAFPHLSLETGAISEKIQRGKHTTRHAELIRITEKSYIVDSPGFTSLFLNHIPSSELQYYFREFKPYLHSCYYNTCQHEHEPDCIIKNEIGIHIDKLRYEQYLNIYNELKEQEERKN